MSDPHDARIGEVLEKIRRRGLIIAAVLIFIALAYVLEGPSGAIHLRAALAAFGLLCLLAFFLAIEALHQRKYVLFAFLAFVAIPAMGVVHSVYLERGTGIALPPRWPPQVDPFLLAAIFGVAFLIGLFISFRKLPRNES